MSPRHIVIDCTFCGAHDADRAREDVVPIWLAKKLAHVAESRHPGSSPSYTNYGFENLAEFRSNSPSTAVPSGGIPAAYKLPEVCVECNGGWMSRLEQAANLIIVGPFEGSRKLLTPYDQLILATWMIKTCLTYDASIEPRYIPEEIGSRVFFDEGCPLRACHVMLGFDPDHYPEGSFVHARYLLDATRNNPSDLSAVLIGFQFDQVILQAIINLSVIEGEESVTGMAIPSTSARYERIWPNREPFMYPSDAALVPSRGG